MKNKFMKVFICFFVCLSSFSVFTSTTNAFSYSDGLQYGISTNKDNGNAVNGVTSTVWNTSQTLSNSSPFRYVYVTYYNPITFYSNKYYDFYHRISLAGSSIKDNIYEVQARIGDDNEWRLVSMVKPYGDYITVEGTLENKGAQSNSITFRYDMWYEYSIPTLYYQINDLRVELTEASALKESLTNTNTSVSNLQTSVNTLNTTIENINSDISNINSDINSVNSSVSTLYGNVTNLNSDIQNLASDVSSGWESVGEEIRNVGGGIFDLKEAVVGGIGTVVAGITNLFANSNNIKDMVQSIADSVANLELSFINWWIEFTENYTYTLMALNNINTSIGKYGDIISSDLVTINGSLYTCTNAVNSTLNALNTDVQEQMIAQALNVTNAISTQTTNIKNGIIEQTNSLNTSIKTMENAIVNKLDETLVLKDKSSVNNNDSSNFELETAINDYAFYEESYASELEGLDYMLDNFLFSPSDDFVSTSSFLTFNLQNVYESNDNLRSVIDLTFFLGIMFLLIGIGVR